MLAGYSDYPGYGNTPPGGIQGFETLFLKSKRLNDERHLGKIDALILWGGADIGTSLYDEKPINHYQPKNPSSRDVFEWELIKKAVKQKIPIIGVCRGAQLLCAFAGGKLAQDVKGHQQPHSIKTHDGKTFEYVSSSHHQMMYPHSLNKDEYEVLATTDNVLNGSFSPYYGLSSIETDILRERLEPEVVLFNEIKAIGIQSHPEWQLELPFNNWCIKEILHHLYGESKT